jgi:predicted DNA-binding transcriptional regulator AlpA
MTKDTAAHTSQRRPFSKELVPVPPIAGSSSRVDSATDPLDLIGKRELARALRINPWTLDRWRRCNPAFPQPIWISAVTPRWRRNEIEEWLASRQRGGTAPDWRNRQVVRHSTEGCRR